MSENATEKSNLDDIDEYLSLDDISDGGGAR